MSSKSSNLGVSLIRALSWAMGGALLGGLIWIIFPSIELGKAFSVEALIDGPALGAIVGGGVGLLGWAITAVVRSRRREYPAYGDEQVPELGVTRGGFKNSRLPAASTQRMRATSRKDVPVERMPRPKNTGGRSQEIGIVLGVVLMAGVLIGVFFGWVELVSVFGSFNLAIYGTVALVLILVVIIAVLESRG